MKFVKILIGRTPGVIITYVAGILEKMVKEFWKSTFVPCMYKFESMQAIYIIVTVKVKVRYWLQ